MKTKQGHEVGSKEHARAIEDAVADRNHLVHGKFLYGCEKCKHLEPIYLGVGVEGPKELRDSSLYIPSPFSTSCKKCGGTMNHVFWGSDEQFEPMAPPSGARCFVIPKTGIDMRYFQSSVFAGKVIRA